MTKVFYSSFLYTIFVADFTVVLLIFILFIQGVPDQGFVTGFIQKTIMVHSTSIPHPKSIEYLSIH